MNIHNGTQLVNRQILRCKMTIEILNNQSKMAIDQMKLNAILVKKCQDKKKILNKIITIGEQQLIDYTTERQQELTKLSYSADAVDKVNKNEKKLIDAVKKYQDDINFRIYQISELDKCTPTNAILTKYKLNHQQI